MRSCEWTSPSFGTDGCNSEHGHIDYTGVLHIHHTCGTTWDHPSSPSPTTSSTHHDGKGRRMMMMMMMMMMMP